ncbi:MAG: alpha/beta fold hydrolase [Alphaproteobacteria bacterium]
MTMVRAFLLAVLALSMAACAPHYLPADPPIRSPELAPTHIVTADGYRLPLRVWPAEGRTRAVILALHGFNDYSRAYEEPAAYWAKRGVATYAYDQRGFGETAYRGRWPGIPTLTGDLATAAELIRREHPDVPLVLVGESMGAAVVMAALAAKHPPDADAAVLAAPAVWSRETMPWYQTASLWLMAHTMPGMGLTAQGIERNPSDNIEMLRELARDPLVIKRTRVDAINGLVDLMDAAYAAAPRLHGRVLVLYGRNEDIIPDGAQTAFEARLPEHGCVRLAHYKHGYHMLFRDLAGETVMGDVVAWIDNPSAPLPSAADTLAGGDAGRGTSPDAGLAGGTKVAGTATRHALSCPRAELARP